MIPGFWAKWAPDWLVPEQLGPEAQVSSFFKAYNWAPGPDYPGTGPNRLGPNLTKLIPQLETTKTDPLLRFLNRHG